MALADDIQQFNEDATTMHDFVHGTSSGYVDTDSGSVMTLPEAADQVQDFITDAESDILTAVSTYTALNPRGNWATSTSYAIKDLVEYTSIVYICLSAHTSGTFSTDLAAGYWAPYQGVGKLIDSAVTYTVGDDSSDDFSNLNDAFEFLSQYRTTYTSGGMNVYVQIQTGYTIEEQLIFSAVDLSFATITAVDATTYIDQSYITTQLTGNGYTYYPFIAAINGAKAPTIGCKLEYSTSWSAHSKTGFFAHGRNSSIGINGSCGITGAYNGVVSSGGGSITGLTATIDLTDCRIGVMALAGGSISAYGLDVSSAGENGVQSLSGGYVSAETITADSCTDNGPYANSGYAVYAQYGGRISAQTMYCEDCAVGGAYSLGGFISAYRINAQAGSSGAATDVVVGDGGHIIRGTGTGGVSQTVGTISADGYISA